MRRNITFRIMIYLIVLIFLNLSCNNKETKNDNGQKSELNKLNINNPAFQAIGNNQIDVELKYVSGILSIFQDSKGTYWIGSQKEGVCFFDGKSFTYFTKEDGLAGNLISSIQEDNNGTIWFETGNGISSYDGKKISTHTKGDFKDKTKNDFYSVEMKSEVEWAKTDSDLWFNGGKGRGVYRFDDQKLNYLAFPVNDNNPDNPHLATDFARGKHNKIWIATYAGVFGYDGDSFTILNEVNFAVNKKQVHIRAVFEDSKGRLWIGNNSIGVLLYNENTIINFTERNGLSSKEQFVSNYNDKLEHVFAIAEDKSGNIWFGDRDTGAWKYDGKTISNFKKRDGLTSNFVQTIYKDNKDELWLGLADGNVFKLNGKRFEKQF